MRIWKRGHIVKKREIVMLEFYEPGAAIVEQSVADAASQWARANKRALDLMLGVQKTMLEEVIFAGNELFDRTRVEMGLFSEFVSKLAESHSVKTLTTMGEECSRHQIDFIRRDCERVFKHGERLIETTSKLFNNHRQD
jgi:hypothetical protein